MGNSRNYFERGNKEYVEGFGFVEKEIFLGLKNILKLNKNNNTILEIEATKDDGSKVFATFDQFILLEEAVDDAKERKKEAGETNEYEIHWNDFARTGASEGNIRFIKKFCLKVQSL